MNYVTHVCFCCDHIASLKQLITYLDYPAVAPYWAIQTSRANLADAVGLVDHEEGDFDPSQRANKALVVEPLGGHVQQRHAAGADLQDSGCRRHHHRRQK